jgi:transmembrane sensor
MSGPGRENKDQLWSEATLWFARMRSPDAEEFRPEFDAWLARGALHRRYYNRAAEYWVDSGRALSENDVQEESAHGPKVGPKTRTTRNRVAALSAACLLFAGSATLWFAHQRDGDRLSAPPVEVAPITSWQFATRAGERRLVRLADGSVVTLGDDSVLRAVLSDRTRRLELARGKARFAVAHDARPFVVFAGGGSVTAHGTVFDVAFVPGQRVSVRLIRGSIDVRPPPVRRGPFQSAARRLQAGESMSFAAIPAPGSSGQPATPAPAADSARSENARDYRDVRLADIVAEANRDAPVPIRFADPATGEKRVSGRLRTGDNMLLAERLAALLDLVVDRRDPSEIVLRAK